MAAIVAGTINFTDSYKGDLFDVTSSTNGDLVTIQDLTLYADAK